MNKIFFILVLLSLHLRSHGVESEVSFEPEELVQQLPNSLKEELQIKSLEISNQFDKGFKWEDLASMVDSSRQYLKTNHSLLPEVEKEAIKFTVGNAVSLINSIFFPVSFVRNIFKYILQFIVEAVYCEKDFGFEKNPGPIESDAIQLFTENLVEKYKHQFWCHQYGEVLAYAIQAAESYTNAGIEDKANCAKLIVNKIIDETDTRLLPDFFVDWIFKKIGASVIDVHFTKRFD